jgi:lysophospholipase L1-like esterase
MAHRKNHPEQYMLWSEGPLFQQSQVLASYSESEFEESFWEKSWITGSLEMTKRRLVEGKPLKIAVTGDSISAGYNASGFLKRQPYESSYPERFCRFLEEKYKTKVTMQNFAVGGWSSNNGLEKADAPASMSPNLLIVAFGMNDTGKTSPDLYASNIKGIIDRVRSNAPECEVILISPMVPNFEWQCKKEENFVALREELIKICSDSIVLADCYSLFKKVTQKKSYYDITGNGLNHPNDFGHKLYSDLLIRSIS